MSVVGVEYLTAEGRSETQPNLGRYAFDLGPEYVDPAAYWVAIFKASDCANRVSPEPPGWVADYPNEPNVTDPAPWVCPIVDDDARPDGAPLHVTVTLPYLEPRYSDAWIAFVLEVADPA